MSILSKESHFLLSVESYIYLLIFLIIFKKVFTMKVMLYYFIYTFQVLNYCFVYGNNFDSFIFNNRNILLIIVNIVKEGSKVVS